NPLMFLVEQHTHEFEHDGKKHRLACEGDGCPMCALSRGFYNAKDDELGKKYYKKKSYVAQVLVVESPIAHDPQKVVKTIEFGPQVFKAIQAGFASGDMEDEPQAFKGGYNFRLVKSKTGSGQNSYSTSTFAPKQSDLEADLIVAVQQELVSLESL